MQHAVTVPRTGTPTPFLTPSNDPRALTRVDRPEPKDSEPIANRHYHRATTALPHRRRIGADRHAKLMLLDPVDNDIACDQVCRKWEWEFSDWASHAEYLQ